MGGGRRGSCTSPYQPSLHTCAHNYICQYVHEGTLVSNMCAPAWCQTCAPAWCQMCAPAWCQTCVHQPGVKHVCTSLVSNMCTSLVSNVCNGADESYKHVDRMAIVLCMCSDKIKNIASGMHVDQWPMNTISNAPSSVEIFM